MCRSFAVALLVGLLAAPVWAQDATKPEANPVAAAAEKLKANPNDTAALQAFVQASAGEVNSLAESKPEEAVKKVAEIEKTLGELKPTDEKAQAAIKSLIAQLKPFGEQIALRGLKLADVEKQLEASPEDAAVLAKYIRKVGMEAASKASSDPKAATELLTAAKSRLEKLKESAKAEEIKTAIDRSSLQFAGVERQIESAKKLLELVGKEAAPLQVEAWVNGAALTDADLKGKVVLLDFWAMWCGPCIATFPHLREWNEQYAEKGLVIIGLTNYYNMKWDEEKQAAVTVRPTPDAPEAAKVTPEDEQKTLAKFAEHHKLHHRFGVQKKDSNMSSYYAVSGIPHAVVIDQAGKVQLIRVGSGEANAKAIGDLLAKLLGTTATAAK